MTFVDGSGLSTGRARQERQVTAGMAGRLVERACAATVSDKVIVLLRDTLTEIERDRSTARANIALAFALMEAQREPAEAIAGDSEGGRLAPWQMRRVMTFIEAKLDEPFTSADLAITVSLSANYFAKAFKRSFRVTPHVYVFARRIERAQELMLTTDEPLSQIAYACGFSDQGHFSRRFRRATGASPLAWRRQRLGGHFGAGRSGELPIAALRAGHEAAS